ncbi:hypothetical protein ACF0H5_024186 [Mactra antiquata]
MVSSPNLTQPNNSSRVKQFPLFSRLLNESESIRSRRHCDVTEPATAPVLFSSMDARQTGSDVSDLDKAHDFKANRPNLEFSPIRLQDPPKTKLKRQLSVDTADRTEALRVRKKVALVGQETDSDSPNDEVDGECDVNHDVIISKSSHLSSGVPIPCKGREVTDRSISIGRQDGGRHPTKSERKHPSDLNSGIPEISYSYEERDHGCLPSPGHFNLSDICLTSPFNSITPNAQQASDKSIFIFPDSVPPKKLSPYKVSHEESKDRESRENRGDYAREYSNRLVTESSRYQSDQEEIISGKSKTGSDGSTTHAISYKLHPEKSHVSERGFIWPETVTLTEPVPLSPRIITTESVNRKTTPSSNERLKRHEEQSLSNRLRMLERERDRAKEMYGCSSNEMSPNSRAVESVRRGLSYQDRSPNEKEIREMNDEVRRQYDRSLSYPRCSPRQMRNRVSNPSPLISHGDGNSQENTGQERYRDRDLFREDVRKRLFMTGEPGYNYGLRRQYSSVTSPQRQESTEIPTEVLQFLHSKNFHPEELENLKDILRRGGSPHEDNQYLRSTSGQYGSSSGLHYRRHQGTSGLILDEDSPRERRSGDIDVRLSVESIKDKNDKKTEDILRELDHDNRDCKCAKIEHEILLMAMDAYSKIRRTDRSADAFEQFQAEINETHANVYNSMRVLCAIKCMCKYGRTLEDMFSGSVVFRLNCPTLDALLDLWHLYKSGDLLRQFKDAFITEELLEDYNCEDIEIVVKIDWGNYLDCKRELEFNADSSLLTSPTKSPLIPVHVRSRSEPASVSKQANRVVLPPVNMSPFRERFSSDSYVELSPRKVFQEINTEKHTILSSSPSKRLTVTGDNVFADDGNGSPLTSPRRRHFVLESQREQENLDAPEPINV